MDLFFINIKRYIYAFFIAYYFVDKNKFCFKKNKLKLINSSKLCPLILIISIVHASRNIEKRGVFCDIMNYLCLNCVFCWSYLIKIYTAQKFSEIWSFGLHGTCSNQISLIKNYWIHNLGDKTFISKMKQSFFLGFCSFLIIFFFWVVKLNFMSHILLNMQKNSIFLPKFLPKTIFKAKARILKSLRTTAVKQ